MWKHKTAIGCGDITTDKEASKKNDNKKKNR